MKILIAPDKFKGSLSAAQLSGILSTVLTENGHECMIHPLADGGDGSIEILEHYLDVEKVFGKTIDPLAREISCFYLRSDNTAFIELASASGYALLQKEERNPMHTSTEGTGRMIRHAIEAGAKQILLFLGGSSTNDAGVGILSELGFTFLDKSGQELEPVGKNLINIASITAPKSKELLESTFILLCDVTNPLYGESGAAYTYARQKGASDKEIIALDDGLINFAKVLQKTVNIDVQAIPGTGAAGGIPAGLIALMGAQKKSGAEYFMGLTAFNLRLDECDIVITGEGGLDGQSLHGKVPGSVLQRARLHEKPVYFFVGHCKYEELPQIPKDHVYAVMDIATDESDAFLHTHEYIIRLVQQFVHVLSSQEE